jgi:hypothetical protein
LRRPPLGIKSERPEAGPSMMVGHRTSGRLPKAAIMRVYRRNNSTITTMMMIRTMTPPPMYMSALL